MNFKDSHHGGHLGFLISGEEAKIYFQDGHRTGHLGYPIGAVLAIFDLQVTSMLPIKFQVKRQ